MKRCYFFPILAILILFVSCASEDDENESGNQVNEACSSNIDCPIGYVCDKEKKICTDKPENGGDDGSDNGDNGDSDTGNNGENGDTDSTTPGKQDGDDDPITGNCTPGKKQTCEYQGDPATENVGPCKAGIRTCKDDGTWGHCEGEVLPVNEIGSELCGNGIDDDCNGVVDDGTDIDGDGYGACKDCCEIADDCNGYDPATINPAGAEISDNGVDDNCNGQIDEDPSCDGSDEPLQLNDYPGNAIKLAHAMGICGDQLVSAEISLAGPAATESIADEQCISISGSGNKISRQSLPMPYYTSDYQTFAATTKFGNNITPKEGSKIAILSTGDWDNPTQEFKCAKLSSGDMKTASKVPEDWMNMMPGCTIPRSPSCGGTVVEDGLTNQCAGKELPTVQDPIMLTLKIKVPMNARAFQFNIFFLSAEYPGTVCADGAFNDFFFALLDSEHNTKYPDDEYQNPYDKNLGKDAKGNFVGIDLAPQGLFTVCNASDSSNEYASFCTEGATLLQGTGFDGMSAGSGGTGWLTTRGNVVPGETITLRLAIFEQGTVWTYGSDHSYDSTVLLDGFKWLPNPAKAGTSQY
ncbi:putative metal-binding motif-containing protein [bacterium]|nr:putative metal-binding motif-containing protein [bacterium]